MFSHEAYIEYLRSAAWQRRRMQCLEAWDYRCYVCGYDFRERKGWLEVHHTNYKTLYREDPVRDLVPLCDLHHRKGKMGWSTVRSWRSSYHWERRISALFRGLWWLVCSPVALVRWLWTRRKAQRP